MIRQTKRWIRDRMKQDTKKRVMIAKIVERPLILMMLLGKIVIAYGSLQGFIKGHGS